jgi:hypothetical protein
VASKLWGNCIQLLYSPYRAVRLQRANDVRHDKVGGPDELAPPGA